MCERGGLVCVHVRACICVGTCTCVGACVNVCGEYVPMKFQSSVCALFVCVVKHTLLNYEHHDTARLILPSPESITAHRKIARHAAGRVSACA